MFSTVQGEDFVIIALLVVLEGLLSADNALVMAVMVLGLPVREHRRALSYGLVGAFALRAVATLLAVYLIRLVWVKLLGGLYLFWLAIAHFARRRQADEDQQPARARPLLGLPAFWATVLRIEMVNLAFSIDSILVAVAMSPKLWVVLSGGLLGIVAMRVVVSQLIALIQRYPPLVDGAFVIIGWVALKLVLEYAHAIEWIAWDVPRGWSIGVVIGIFVATYVYARSRGPRLDEHPSE